MITFTFFRGDAREVARRWRGLLQSRLKARRRPRGRTTGGQEEFRADVARFDGGAGDPDEERGSGRACLAGARALADRRGYRRSRSLRPEGGGGNPPPRGKVEGGRRLRRGGEGGGPGNRGG